MSPDGSTVLFGALPNEFRFSVSEKRTLTRFVRKLSVQIAHGKYFECLLADDKELQRLNSQFLQKNYPTDVLSFPTDGQPFAVGECAISVERARFQSTQFGHSLIEEIQILMLHGLLHLVGFDHETDAGEMAATELQWRAQLKLPSSLIERSHRLKTVSI